MSGSPKYNCVQLAEQEKQRIAEAERIRREEAEADRQAAVEADRQAAREAERRQREDEARRKAEQAERAEAELQARMRRAEAAHREANLLLTAIRKDEDLDRWFPTQAERLAERLTSAAGFLTRDLSGDVPSLCQGVLRDANDLVERSSFERRRIAERQAIIDKLQDVFRERGWVMTAPPAPDRPADPRSPVFMGFRRITGTEALGVVLPQNGKPIEYHPEGFPTVTAVDGATGCDAALSTINEMLGDLEKKGCSSSEVTWDGPTTINTAARNMRGVVPRSNSI